MDLAVSAERVAPLAESFPERFYVGVSRSLSSGDEARVAQVGLQVESERLVLPHRDRTDGFYIARLRS